MTSYTPIEVDAVGEAPKSATEGTSYPVAARCVAILQVPEDADLRISFDRRKDFIRVRGGETFEAHGSEPFKSVEMLWTQIESETGDPEYIVIFAGDETVKARAGAYPITVPDDATRAGDITLYTATTAAAERVDIAGAETVIIAPRSANAASIYVAHSEAQAILGAGGDAEEIRKTDAPREFTLAGADELWVGGTTADKFTVRTPGV